VEFVAGAIAIVAVSLLFTAAITLTFFLPSAPRCDAIGISVCFGLELFPNTSGSTSL